MKLKSCTPPRNDANGAEISSNFNLFAGRNDLRTRLYKNDGCGKRANDGVFCSMRGGRRAHS